VLQEWRYLNTERVFVFRDIIYLDIFEEMPETATGPVLSTIQIQKLGAFFFTPKFL
jgi:hypothetical protein